MISLRLAAGAALVGALVAGCGGYAGDHPPVGGGPNDFPTAAQTGAIPQDPTVPPVQPQAPAPSTGSAPATAPTRGGTSSDATGDEPATSAGSCTLVGKISTVTVRASSKIRSVVTSLRVTLSQGTLSRTAWTPIDPDHPRGMPLVRGVIIASDAFTFVLGGDGKPQAALPGAWNGDKKARLLVEALAGDGRTIYQQDVVFAFGKSYPNGKACDKTPALSFLTELTKKDQFGPLPKS